VTRGQKWFQQLANLTVGGTGLVYGWMLYCITPAEDDPFSIAVVNHPWQPEVKNLHVIFAPLLVFAIGMIWPDHVWQRISSGLAARRRIGLLLATLAVPMIASGYLLQTSVDETWNRIWIWTHVASSVLWILAFVGHQISRRSARGRRS